MSWCQVWNDVYENVVMNCCFYPIPFNDAVIARSRAPEMASWTTDSASNLVHICRIRRSPELVVEDEACLIDHPL